ncbi:hypothetical protein [Pseudarthrobacter sp. lyk4-40-TYG-27]|nr:hypothetical protein [Pseudarthrobacter sp. lyk4-40-TYG-27]
MNAPRAHLPRRTNHGHLVHTSLAADDEADLAVPASWLNDTPPAG